MTSARDQLHQVDIHRILALQFGRDIAHAPLPLKDRRAGRIAHALDFSTQRGRQIAVQEFQKTGFSGAVRAENRPMFALPQLPIHRAQHGPVPDIQIDVGQSQQHPARSRRGPPRPVPAARSPRRKFTRACAQAREICRPTAVSSAVSGLRTAQSAIAFLAARPSRDAPSQSTTGPWRARPRAPSRFAGGTRHPSRYTPRRATASPAAAPMPAPATPGVFLRTTRTGISARASRSMPQARSIAATCLA